jgi:hypothetical protein
MEGGIGDQPTNGLAPLPRGLLIGAIFAFCAVVWWVGLLALSERDSLKWLSLPANTGLIVILLAGYLLGIVRVVPQPTRRLGIGILTGLTLTFPTLVILTIFLALAINCCQ